MDYANIIGRKNEILKFKRLYDSPKSEFVAIYGRRRVGKSFLVNEVFGKKILIRKSGQAVLMLFIILVQSMHSLHAQQVYEVDGAPGYNCWPMIQPVGNRIVCIYTIGKAHNPWEKGRAAYAKYSDD